MSEQPDGAETVARPLRVVLLAGTRPEVLKLAPLWRALETERATLTATFATLEQQPSLIGLAARDLELSLDRRALEATHPAMVASVGSLEARAARLLAELAPGLVVVQGDTNSALAGARAAHARGLPIAHVEAGLRSGDLSRPFPEERNRIEITRLASRHYAPTPGARANLEREGIPAASILVTGNTGVDLLLSRRLYARDPAALWSAAQRRIVVTTHRHESHGAGVRAVCTALRRIVESRAGIEIQFVLHPNPNASAAPQEMLAGRPGFELLPPLAQSAFLALLDRALFVITDSGGVQEEAPYLGLPVLVTRTCTERPEALAAGTARLVGHDPEAILSAACELLDDRPTYLAMSRVAQPFGDGKAAQRIAADLAWHFGARTRESGPSAPALRRFLLSPHVLRADGRLLSWRNPAHPGYPYPEAAALVLCALCRHASGTEAVRARIAERLWSERGALGGYGKQGREYAFDTALVAQSFLVYAETSALAQHARWLTRSGELLDVVRAALARRSALLDPRAEPDAHWSRSFGCHLLKCTIALESWRKTNDADDTRLTRALLSELLALQEDGRFRIHAGSELSYVHAHLYALEGLVHLAARGWSEVQTPLEAGVACMTHWQRPDGAMPAFAPPRGSVQESVQGSEGGATNEPRADATAQAIRLWSCMEPRAYAPAIRRARAFLARLQTTSGGLRYSDESMDENTWCSAFALQAEAWYERGRAEPLELF